MFSLANILGLMLWPFFTVPATSTVPTNQFQAEWDASSTVPGEVVIYSDINGVATTTVVHAPYGVQSEIESFSNGTSTQTFATTTPITQADIAQMQARQAAIDADMQREFADEQKMFRDLWNGNNF